MKSMTIPIEGRTVIDVQLTADILGLEEVVVVGYGRQLKTDLTGSISKVKTEDLNQMPTVTMENALQGVTSGVHIEQASGKLGEAVKVRIRGSSSISADNQPLYVVDGIPLYTEDTGITTNHPTNPLAQINMNDVETIDVLKDASAAAIYGSRAANGVIMITTKRGKAGATNIDLNFSRGVSNRANVVGFLNADEYRELMNEAGQNYIDDFTNNGDDPYNIIGYYFDENIDSYIDFMDAVLPGYKDGDSDQNWEEEAFRTGSVTNFDLSASGGSEKTNFFTGLSYIDNEGIIIKNRFRRASARMNLDHAVSDRVKIGMNSMISQTKLDRVSNDNAFSTPMQLVALPAVQPKYDTLGELNTETVYFNGLIAARDNFVASNTYRVLESAYISWEPIRGLTWRTDAALDLTSQKEDEFRGRLTNDGSPDGDGVSRSMIIAKLTTNNYLSFSRQIGEVSNIEVVTGMAFENIKREWNTINATGFPSDAFQTIASATTAAFFSSAETSFAYISYFGRLNYKLSDKYLLGASVRRDGSSRFGTNSRYGTFPAASLGWIVSRESFLQNAEWLSFLKLRSSYGVTGNSGIDNFAHLGTYVGADYAGVSGIRPWSLASPDLKWETTGQFDVGIDFGFLRNRINGEIDYYQKKTTDLLLAKTLPTTSGYSGVIDNVGVLENKGWEFVINSNNLVGDFKWNSSLNISQNRNKILRLGSDEGEDYPDIIGAANGINRVREGEPLGVFVTRKYAGVNPDNGRAMYEMEDGTTTDDYNLAPNLVVGDPNPDLVGGMTNNFEYKGFDLNVLVSFVYGNMVYNGGGKYQSNQGSDFFDNQTKDQMDRWQQPGDDTDIPRAYFWGNEYSGTNPSSRYIQDASYLRIKSISLGYNLQAQWLERAKLRSCRIYASASNLFTWTNYSGWDPEVNFVGTNRTTTTSNITQGYDFYTAPQARTISVGIRVGL
jgi:TonB-dependent starch-binding outer membrane protein SusC